MYLGLALCLIVGVVATLLGDVQHFVGAPMLGLFFGILISNLCPAGFVSATKKGAGFSSKYLLKTGIILVGGTLSFSQIIGVGLDSLPLICFNICLSFAVAFFMGKLFRVPEKTRILVGGGTAICGGTAIATLSPIIKSTEEDMAYALTAIFLFDIFAAIMWPYAAVGLGLTPDQYSIIGGLAISDTSSVTAAAGTFDMLMGANAMTSAGVSGGDSAIIVKLTRTTMLVVVAIVVMLVNIFRESRLEQAAGTAEKSSFGRNVVKAFPFFILGFLALAILNTLIDFSTLGGDSITLAWICKKGYKYLITVALVGIGYKIKFKGLFTKGGKPFILGGITWLALAISCLVYVMVLM
ncbi:MAG: putative sulfate exporter family transporter [Clostridiales bacterium]|nr:putative sulfate exporter family transporter [Clostridiales bacterium]